MILNTNDLRLLIKELENPSPPNDKLKQAYGRYNKHSRGKLQGE